MGLLLVCVGLLYLPTGFEGSSPDAHSALARARVLAVDNARVRQTVIIKTGDQKLTVELLEGPFKGQTCAATNQLTGKLELDEFFVEGNEILLQYTTRDGAITTAVARGTYRLRLEWTLVALFAGLLILVAGWVGVKAILSFAFAALVIWKVMVPAFLKGHDPIWIALAVVGSLTAAISFLVGGVERKGLVTFVGSFTGLLATCVLAQVFVKAFHLHGAVRPYSESLLYTGFPNLDLSKLFVASVFIACAGAVMDVSMDISAAMHELQLKKPHMGPLEHMRSGMAVGRLVIGTMTTTLLLAYSGSYIALLMLFMGQGVPLVSMLNRSFLAAEILNTIVGSFGVVLVAPLTALAGGLIYHYPKSPPSPATSD